jgi:TonB family protein
MIVLLAGGGIGRLTAQDVTISPVQWTNPKGAPDELPERRGNPRIPFPEELRGTPDIGYAVLRFMLDEKGHNLGTERATTTPAFVRAYEQSADEFRFSPARRNGKPVNAEVTLALIFNPASAATDKPDATPRLVEVSTIRAPRPKDAKRSEPFPDRVIFADVAVDETGRIVAVRNAPAEWAEKFAIAIKNWRFLPARKNGQPVAAEVRVPFVIEVASPEIGTRVAPRVTFQEPPIYPFPMRASGMRGEVVVDFIVDIEGRVRNAFVIKSLNPAFDDPALEAVRKWQFESGRVGDRPVNTHMQVPVVFQLQMTYDGGSGPTETKKKADQAKLPEEFRYDTAPILRSMVWPVYPYPLLKTKREGRALVGLVVDESGRVVQVGVREASAPEFAAALTAAVEQFLYDPAVRNGRPHQALLGFQQEFKSDEEYQLVSDLDLDLLKREEKKPQTIATLKDIDGKLTAISQRPPRFPLSEMGKSERGQALIEFIVDDDGRARLPRIVSASSDAFGYAAVQGVAAWRFEPPTRGGRATFVRVQVPIVFTSPAKPASY